MSDARHFLTWFLNHTTAQWIFLSYFALLGIELVIGRAQRASRRDVALNFAYVLTVLFVLIFIREWGAQVAANIAKLFGGPYIDLTFGAHGRIWANIAAFAITLFIYDAFYYWHHRFQHVSAAAWVTHKLHHSDENLGISTAYKHHWSDDALRIVTITVPMAAIFKLEPTTIFWIAYVVSWQGLMIHMNVDWDFGWLHWLTPSPNMHRLHHSVLPEHRDKNFGAVFTVFDRLFGTYMAPSRDAPPTGLDTGEKYPTLVHAHLYPFAEWARLARGRRTDIGEVDA